MSTEHSPSISSVVGGFQAWCRPCGWKGTVSPDPVLPWYEVRAHRVKMNDPHEETRHDGSQPVTTQSNGEPSEVRVNLERSLNRMVKAAFEEGWTDNRIMLASAAFMTRVDAYLVPVRDAEIEQAGRATVTPEQVDAAAKLIARGSTNIAYWDKFEDDDREHWFTKARAVFELLGLSVAEGETT